MLRANTDTLLSPMSFMLPLQSASKDKRLEFEMLRARAKADKRQARHSEQMQKLEDRYK